MSDQITQPSSQEDAWLVEFYKHFDTMLAADRSDIDWSQAADFQIFSEFLIGDIQNMQEKMKSADDEYLFYVCRHTFNIMDWIRLMLASDLPTFGGALELLFEKHFGDKHILQKMYDTCFEKWVSRKNGQYQIGENFYNIIEGNLYYRNRFGQWFEVDRVTVFDLQPDKESIENVDLIEKLNNEYEETWYDVIIRRWENKNYEGTLPDDFLRFGDEETSPEAYFDFTAGNIKTLLKNPVSISELERWNGGSLIDLEYIVKVSALVLKIVKKRRKDDSHTVYLLRDCLMFYEAQKTLDLLNSRDTSSDQILIGRKLLTHESRKWGYYIVTLESLYIAHKRYPTNFDEFYNEYARLLDMFFSLNAGFAEVVGRLANYIKEHIQTDKNKIVVFDIGFQGSIALLVKYIIDRHIKLMGLNVEIETDVSIGVGAEWSKELFGDRYESDYFPFLNRGQLMARSDELFHYKQGSLEAGKLLVVMGDKKWQQKATIELVTFVTVALLEQKDKKG